MPIEQLLFLIAFLVIPLLQNLAERRRKQRLPAAESSLDPEPGEEPVLVAPAANQSYIPAPSPAPIVRASPPLEHVMAKAAQARQQRAAASLEMLQAMRAKRDRLKDAVPRDRASLRRAMLLVEILGPPRGLESRR